MTAPSEAVPAAISAHVLTEAARIHFMARRRVSQAARRGTSVTVTGIRFNVATVLLHDLLTDARLNPQGLMAPDPVANEDWNSAGGLARSASVFADGTPVSIEEQRSTLTGMLATYDDASPSDRLQYVITRIHPAACAYAEGRATYATSMLNAATRVFRAAGLDLSATIDARGTVWVSDGFGDAYAGLRPDEIIERDAGLATHRR